MTKDYISPSSGEPCTPPQYIAEILITRQESINNNPVPYKFWNLPKYKKRFIMQIIWVNALLKICKPEAVIAALMSKSGSNIYSTNNKLLLTLILIEQTKIKQLESDLDKVTETIHKDPIPMKKFNSTKTSGILNKLREIDGRKEDKEDKDDNVNGEKSD